MNGNRSKIRAGKELPYFYCTITLEEFSALMDCFNNR